MNKVWKKLLISLMLLLSPLAMLALVGTIYITVRVIGGLEVSAAYGAFKAIVHNLMPYFPYLTGIPIALLIPVILKKSKFKLNILKK